MSGGMRVGQGEYWLPTPDVEDPVLREWKRRHAGGAGGFTIEGLHRDQNAWQAPAFHMNPVSSDDWQALRSFQTQYRQPIFSMSKNVPDRPDEPWRPTPPAEY